MFFAGLYRARSNWRVGELHIRDIMNNYSGGSRIFPQGGAPTPKIAIIFQIFAEDCMKMKEFGPPGGARVPGAPLGSANEL